MNLCNLCGCWSKVDSEDISWFTMKHPEGEELQVALYSCSHCEQLSLPEQHNVISYMREKPDSISHTNNSLSPLALE